MSARILKGMPLKGTKIEKGFGEYFFEQSQIYGDKIFQIDGNTGYAESYNVVRQRSVKIAIYLQSINIKPKDVVMVCCPNSLDNIIPCLATFYLGGYAATIDPKQTLSDVKHSIGLVEPRVIFVEENSLHLVESSMKDSHLKPQIIVIGKSDKYVIMKDLEVNTKEDKSFKPIRQNGSDITAILFSSGTTSAPKGIYVSNSYILNSSLRMSQHNNAQPEVIFHATSLYWISAWILTAMVIAAGTKKVVVSAITGEKLLQIIDKYKVTYIFSITTFTYEITNLPEEIFKKYDTSSLYSVCLGGAPMDPNQILRLRKLLPHTNVAMCYGSTEANFIAGHDYTNQKAYQEKISSSGTLLADSEMKFVDVETGKLVGPYQEGELYIKSNYLMSGYHNFENPDLLDEDGFLKLGDIGHYDNDGYIYVTDRIGEMFKYKAHKISPTHLENILMKHPAVAEAVVFGVPHPVDMNHPAACVVLKNGTKIAGEELVDFVNSKVFDVEKLREGVMIVDSIFKTPTGKFQRRIIRDSFIKTKKETVNIIKLHSDISFRRKHTYT